MAEMKYSRLPLEENDGVEIGSSRDGEEEKKDLLESRPYGDRRRRHRRVLSSSPSSSWLPRTKLFLFVAVLTGFNILFTAVLFGVAVYLRRNYNCVAGPQPPWSPVRNDGVIRHVNKVYKPEKIFQSPTSEEVEAAWEDWLTEYDHLLVLPIEETKDQLPITVDAFLDPGYAVYGLAVYHQMHCLNHIRKTFHADKFFPNMSRTMVEFHKDHCFDMIRQSILCHGDIAMMHWWNDTYSYVDEDGHVQLTEHYFSLTPSQRAEGAFAKWDTKVQCRDMDAINAWTKAHSMEDEKYIATVGQLKRRRSVSLHLNRRRQDVVI